MNLRKPNFKRLLFFTILIVLFNSAVYYLFSLQDKAYADAPKISKDSVDFLTSKEEDFWKYDRSLFFKFFALPTYIAFSFAPFII